MVHLITGYKGSEHIKSADTRSFNSAMFGNGQFVMEIGEELDASIINNNTVRVLDGDILMQGGHIRIETNTYEDSLNSNLILLIHEVCVSRIADQEPL